MRGAIYVRVSKAEEGVQDPNNQLDILTKWAEGLSVRVQPEYIFIDYASGGDSNRPEFQKMLGQAAQHRFDIILVWALDRFSRESMHNTFGYIDRLRRANVGIKSYTESWLDIQDEGIVELLCAVFAWVAKFERERISARTKAALQRRRNLGLPMGSNTHKKKKSNVPPVLVTRQTV